MVNCHLDGNRNYVRGLKEMKKATRNHSTKTRIILPFVVAKALNWWYRYPLASPSRQRCRIIRYEYPHSNPDYIMIGITESPRKSTENLQQNLQENLPRN